ncbi:MAG: DnaJ domain-containing protein [Pseudomonadales bacterium]
MEKAVDYYQVLHVNPDAPLEIIKASYRALMQSLKHHPDLGGDQDSAALINEAYATLSKPESREAYDRLRAEQSQRFHSAAHESRPDSRERSTHSTTATENARISSPQAYKVPLRLISASRCPFCQAANDNSGGITHDASCAQCLSPLTTKEREISTQAGLRAIDRMPKEQDIEIYTQWPGSALYGRTLDISLNGMLFQTRAEMSLQQIIKISCTLCEATARVAHVGGASEVAKIGVEFVTLRFTQARGSFVSTRA